MSETRTTGTLAVAGFLFHPGELKSITVELVSLGEFTEDDMADLQELTGRRFTVTDLKGIAT